MNGDFVIIRFISFILLSIISVLVTLFLIVAALWLALLILSIVVVILYYVGIYILIGLFILFLLPLVATYIKAAFANKREDFTSFRKEYLRTFWNLPKEILAGLYEGMVDLRREVADIFHGGWTWVRVGGKWGRWGL
jgi:hypothetical protein